MTDICPSCGRPMGDLDADGAVGRRHPGTSRAAAKLSHKAEATAVLRFLYRNGPCTAAQIADAMGRARNQTAARLQALRQGGFVTYLTDNDGKIIERPTGPRAKGQVQVITPMGQMEIGRLGV